VRDAGLAGCDPQKLERNSREDPPTFRAASIHVSRLVDANSAGRWCNLPLEGSVNPAQLFAIKNHWIV
jgi:hypothetical protein